MFVLNPDWQNMGRKTWGRKQWERIHWIRWKREIVGRAARISLSSWEVNESEMAGTRTNKAVTSQWWSWWAWRPRGVWAPWPGPPWWCWWPSWWPPPAPTCPPTATSTPCAPASCKPPPRARGYSTPLSPPRLLTPSSPWCRLLLISGTSAASGSLLPEFQVTLSTISITRHHVCHVSRSSVLGHQG